MFGNDGNGKAPAPPETENADLKRQIEELPWRCWRVRRLGPTSSSPAIEQIDVIAHGIEYGAVIAFKTFVWRNGTILQTTPRVFNAWLDVEEIPIAALNGSITH